jgi:PGF-CTERM protein
MRTLIALAALLLIAAPVAADEPVAADGETTLEPLDHPCDPGAAECDHEDSPGVGVVAALGALGAIAFVARRR